MDFRLSEQQQMLRMTVREFAEAEIRPFALEWDEAQHFPAELIPKLAAMGLMGVQCPEEYGGAAMSALEYCIAIEELARVCPGVAVSVAAHNGLCAAHICKVGTPAQKTRFLAPLASGQKIGAWGLTEASSGSDAGSMRTVASRTTDGWILNGAKVFITHGRVGDVHIIMAISDPRAGKKGISAFIVEKGTPGLKSGKKENKLGMRASDTSEVILENCYVPQDQLLGTEGSGFVDAMRVLDAGRIGIAALSVGLAQGAYEASLNYSIQRQSFGQPIASFQAIQWKLADNATHIDAARLLTYRAASGQDEGEWVTIPSAMAKLFASEIAVRVAEDCVQIHGGYGFVKDYPAEKYFRDVKLLTIGEGTSEIQRMVIARHLVRSAMQHETAVGIR
jgi:alkylation response protein AidB-like acyl-CoA dehydrogenase